VPIDECTAGTRPLAEVVADEDEVRVPARRVPSRISDVVLRGIFG